jgi:predicted small secreted protein
MKTLTLIRGTALLFLAASLFCTACNTTPKQGQRVRTAKEAAKIYILAGNWSPTNGDGNQVTFVPDSAGPSTGRVIGIFSDAGTYTASEVQPETGRFSMWINAGRIDSDDPLSRTSFSGEFSADGKLLSLTRHWGGGMPDETKTYRR